MRVTNLNLFGVSIVLEKSHKVHSERHSMETFVKCEQKFAPFFAFFISLEVIRAPFF